MSRIRFEWDIESARVDRSDGEDPGDKRRGRRRLLRLLLLLCLLLAALASVALLLRQRLIDVENQVAQLLQDTVKAEVAALRIGDLNAFMSIQAADETWRGRQRTVFADYANLKAEGEIELTGNILSVAIEGERARALAQENIRGLPYARLWFYRRIDGRWRHTPQDYAFWGDWDRIESGDLRVDFREADRQLGRQVARNIASWLEIGCAILGCAQPMPLIVEISPQFPDTVALEDASPTRLLIRSPYTDLARADTPFDGGLQLQAGKLLARLYVLQTSSPAPAETSDAAFLRESAVLWLAEQFTRIDSGATLMRSLAQNYGVDAVRRLLPLLEDAGDASVLARVVDLPLSQAALDWRDFIAWRLRSEDLLIASRAEAEWLRLVDAASDEARLAAYARYSRNAPPRSYRVINHTLGADEAGRAQLRATVEAAADHRLETEDVVFTLVNDVWLRTS